MGLCFFVSDLHGRLARYRSLFDAIDRDRPEAVFLGGDLLPSHGFAPVEGEEPIEDFVRDFLMPAFLERACRPRVFLILGNDDPRAEEASILEGEDAGAWEYIHDRSVPFEGFQVFGYQYVPPTPFRLKDWERYDVSRYTDPGCVSPEHGGRTHPVERTEVRHATIQKDLDSLTNGEDLENAIFLLHAPPHKTRQMIDHVPLDVHVGSIAIRRFIEERQPLLTLHGHIHESTRITGEWQDRIGRTCMLGAAHHGPELSLVRFHPARPSEAVRELV
jgi:Icc-related predicted phosphoesterase